MLKKFLVVLGLVILVGGGFFKLSGLYDAVYSPKIMVKSAPQKIDTPVGLVGRSWYNSGCRLDANGWNALRSAIWDPIADARRAIAGSDFRLAKVLGRYSSRRHLETGTFNRISCSKNVPAMKAPGWSSGSFAPDMIDSCTLFRLTVRGCYVDLYNWVIFHNMNYPNASHCSYNNRSLKNDIRLCRNTRYIDVQKKILSKR